ncbi:MAG TPA: aminotransferase class V-fold PLP-dependent enzyme [Actinomycetota bacterium]|nr:aminotransferase class V-fold PLP-dependent enzyme [Actinomycetota bacterium]
MSPGTLDPWRAWHDDLLDNSLIHADAAGCSARSRRVTAAVKEHLDLEATNGAYIAEEMAADRIEAARAGLSRLAGGGRVAFAQNASQAFRWLISAWPLPPGASVGTVPGEYPANAATLEMGAVWRDLRLVQLPTDPLGYIDIEGAEKLLPELDLIAFPHIPSHRGIAQPADAIAELCRAHGVDLILDAAQSFGQQDVSRIRPSAFVGTSRKWLQGPRGVGFVVVADGRIELDGPTGPEEGDAGVAERVGLATAVAELERRGIDAVAARISELVTRLREGLTEKQGWNVLEPSATVAGSTTLRHPDHDPVAMVHHLRTCGVIASAIPVARAPNELDAPLLRFSLHAYSDGDWVDRIVEAIPA